MYTGLEIEGDFSDLYSNCNKSLVLASVEKACSFASFRPDTFEYIKILISCIMDHSYFKEPTGIFKTLKGFSMGDKSAARGSEIILRIAEMEIFNSLSRHKILKNVKRYLRFRDDVSLHLSGAPEDILKCVQIICNGYPEALRFNMETRVLHGKYLNIRIYNKPGLVNPLTTVLRKPNNKYNIIPPDSNVAHHYKKMAGLSYFRTIKLLSSDPEEYIRQRTVVSHILKSKRFSIPAISKMGCVSKKTVHVSKRFLSTITFDQVTNRHKFITKMIRQFKLDPDKYYRPACIPGVKLENLIFTIRKMRGKLCF